LAELDGVRRALIRRGKAIEANEDVEELSAERERSWEGFSDEEVDDDAEMPQED
jgi:hypothetical protein